MKFSTNPLAQTITQLCQAKEIKHIVICPGSRNAPLTIGFSENPYFTCYSIVDERAAAFFALGIAQQTGHPAAVVCTSGSAVLNFYPAIAEAFYSDIPLVVLSADRPPHLIDIGDGQTINQENIFEKHILYSANLKCEESFQSFNNQEINRAINLSIQYKGPIHINAPFDEPLYNTCEHLSSIPNNIKPVQQAVDSIENLQELAKTWSQAKKKLILVGVLPPHSLDQDVITHLTQDPSVLVFTETTSNLHHKQFISSIDQLIATFQEGEFKSLQPDLLVSFGGMIVSKKLKVFLRKYPAKQHWHIDEKKAFDTFFILKKHLKVTPNYFLKTIVNISKTKKSDYQKTWLYKKKYRESKHQQFIEQLPFSDLKVFDCLLKKLPKQTVVHLSNSSIIRYAQLFSWHKSIEVYCNRGTSGIDGSTSTAVGFAATSKKPVILITGDLSFFYDANGLWNNYIPNNFRIILINNQGGGIFRILPGDKKASYFEPFFETTHKLTAKHHCNLHKLSYQIAKNELDLKKELSTFFDKSLTPKLLEINTPRELNDQLLAQYFMAIS